MNLRSELRIRTPEGILFSYALAGPVTRCMAWVLDFIVIWFLSTSVGKSAAMMRNLSPDFSIALLVVGYFVISTGYGIAMEWAWRGQTLGKKLLGLRVADARGFRLQFHQIVLRNLLRAVDSLPFCYLVGGVACLFSRRSQRLGDLAAGTVVVHIRKFDEPDLEQLLAGRFNSLREHPHLAARLRQRVSPNEARLALEAILRREEFAPAERVSLFSELAAHFKELVPFPADATESMPDEQYVRNVADVLFRTRAQAERAETPVLHAPMV
jgi:uncharacterized RDD family membrane protein YckC